MEPPDDQDPAPRKGRRGLSSRRRFLLGGLYLGYLAGLLWVAERLFWRLIAGWRAPAAPRPDASPVWDHYYPELRASGATVPRGDGDDHIDVLLLGGSVLQQAEGAIEAALRAGLGARVRVFSLAKSAHTSRDSFLKWGRVAGRRFDAVVIYDSINDVRMNCCPEGAFRDDYTHCRWYRELDRRLAAGRLTIPELITDSATRGIASSRRLRRPSWTSTCGRRWSRPAARSAATSRRSSTRPSAWGRWSC